jgi:ABC-type phosphate transport system substrate-binding protein
MRISPAAVVVLMLSASAFGQVPAPLLGASALAQTQAPVPAFRVIVHPGNSQTHLGRDFVAQAFLRKTARWPSGETIRPVDQDSDSPARRRFSSDVLHRSVAAVRSYWQQLIFSGRGLPPPELDSDQDVLRYVARNAGAIGYVSGNSELSGVKVVNLD